MTDPQDPLSIPHLIARRIVASATRGTPSAIDLADAISEVTLQTTIAGANTLKLAVIDPEWTIARSGFLDQNQDGLLDAVEVEFPDASGWFWRLCAVDITDDLTGPNLTLTFEDRIVAYLRDHWGHKTVKSGTTTRAQFIAQLVAEVGRSGDVPKIPFVCHEINKLQPVQTDTTDATTGTTTVLTPAGKATVDAKHNKKRGVHPRAAITIKGLPPTQFALQNINALLGTAERKHASTVATQALMCAAIGESAIGMDPNTFKNKYQGVLQGDPAKIDVHDAVALTEAFLDGGHGFQAGGAIKLSKTISDPGEIATRVEASGEAADFYGKHLPEAKAIIAAYGGVAGDASSSTPESDVSQLTRGTTDNPDEDSWDCINRLAQQVNWPLFSDGTAIYYDTGPELIAQKPVLYLDRDRDDDRARVVSISGTFDNTAFVTRETTVHKGKVRRKARVQKPASPATVRLDLICDIDEFRGGEVLVLQNYGPLNGRWIVADATRNCMRDLHTSFQLAPPTQPTPEPQAQADPTGSTTTVAPGAHGGFNFPLPPGTFVAQARWTQDQGVDIAAPGLTPLLAVGPGKVVKRGISGFGNDAPVLKLDHTVGGYGFVYYGHAGPAGPKVGEKVKAGAVIGEVGAGKVGISSGPHLEIGFCDANGTPTPGSSDEMLKQLKRSVITG